MSGGSSVMQILKKQEGLGFEDGKVGLIPLDIINPVKLKQLTKSERVAKGNCI